MEHQDWTRLFRERAEAVQTVVADISGLHQAFLYAIELTKKQGGSTMAAPTLSSEERSQLSELCRQAEITLLTENLRNCADKIQTGLTVGGWGVAETCTVVLDSTPEDVRIATMLTETHVAVIPRSRVKPDMTELEPELSETMKSAPRYFSFISGASRTADIERVLTIGVHGPQELHVLFLDDKPA